MYFKSLAINNWFCNSVNDPRAITKNESLSFDVRLLNPSATFDVIDTTHLLVWLVKAKISSLG